MKGSVCNCTSSNCPLLLIKKSYGGNNNYHCLSDKITSNKRIDKLEKCPEGKWTLEKVKDKWLNK